MRPNSLSILRRSNLKYVEPSRVEPRRTTNATPPGTERFIWQFAAGSAKDEHPPLSPHAPSRLGNHGERHDGECISSPNGEFEREMNESLNEGKEKLLFNSGDVVDLSEKKMSCTILTKRKFCESTTRVI